MACGCLKKEEDVITWLGLESLDRLFDWLLASVDFFADSLRSRVDDLIRSNALPASRLSLLIRYRIRSCELWPMLVTLSRILGGSYRFSPILP